MKTDGKSYIPSVWHRLLPIVIVCGCAVVTSYLLGPSRYAQRILLLIVLWAAGASCFNIISGYAGQVVFGYMMFVGAGAYTTVLLFKFLSVTPWLGMWAGALIAVITALIIGLPTLRLQGAFFAIATIAFPLITFPILNYLGLEELSIPFTGHGPTSMQFRDMRYYVYIASALLGGVLVTVRMMESSRFGYSLKALKQNPTAAEGMGINTYANKLVAFMLSAGLGALMGTVYSFGLLYVVTTHAVFGIFIMVRIFSITLVGGAATLWGPFVAACILVPIGEFLNSQFGDRYPGVQDVIYGLALIGAILYMPEGIWGKIRRSFHTAKSASPITLASAENLSDPSKPRLLFEPVHSNDVENPATMPLLTIERIHKSFGGVHALKDVTLQVPGGKVTGIIGPNGSGKTTLFNVINGYLTPDRGRILFQGQEITRFSAHTTCRLGIGRTFQVPQIFSNMTVLENIMIGAFGKGEGIGQAYADAEKIARAGGLWHRAQHQAVGLTLWETKMLEFSRALATNPILLLIDEPMAGLNPDEASRIGEIIRAIAASGTTVIVIEHVVHALVKIADWMVGLDHGTKVAEGPPQEVIDHPHMIEAYLGAKWRERHARS
jgi:ABC-type branched-subunit amino acid transport system ATPase component/ABC-type branched-subunit amino acid transport system permease subunit